MNNECCLNLICKKCYQVERVSAGFIGELWNAIRECIDLNGAEIYAFTGQSGGAYEKLYNLNNYRHSPTKGAIFLLVSQRAFWAVAADLIIEACDNWRQYHRPIWCPPGFRWRARFSKSFAAANAEPRHSLVSTVFKLWFDFTFCQKKWKIWRYAP